MKKVALIVALVVALAVLSATVAIANGGPHGGYSAVTDACAGCHRTHTAPAAQLLIDTDPALCLTCHGAAATGANTDVMGGVFDNSFAPSNGLGTLNAPLKGGGFTQWRHEHQGAFAATTSAHFAPLAGPDTSGAWGASTATAPTTGTRGVKGPGPIDNGRGFRCAACHDPHGSTNWRILKTTINGNAVTVRANNGGAEEASKSYTTDTTDNYGSGISTMCAACHPAYHQTAAGQGSTINGGTYTHRIDMAFSYNGNANPETNGFTGVGDNGTTYHLPLADTTGTGGTGTTVNCLTCHVSHGTSAAMTNWAAGTYDPAGALGPIPSGDSALLRLPNRGVCEVCHQK